MLADVLTVLKALDRSPELLTTRPHEPPVAFDVPVTVDDRALTPAVNAVLEETEGAVAVVMADLALVTPAALERLFEAPGDLVFAPGRAGGTNAFLSRHDDFRVDYHGTSYLDHLRIARELGARVTVVDSHRLAVDVDERADLVELLIHGEGQAHDWLTDAGFELETSGGRVGLSRT